MSLGDPNQRRERFRQLQARAENRARKARMAFTLRPGFALILYDQQKGRCAVSGFEFNLQRFPEALVKHPFAPSIDRRLSSGGYTEDNVRLVCVAVNFGMGQWGEELYMTLARSGRGLRKQRSHQSRPGRRRRLESTAAGAHRRCGSINRQAKRTGERKFASPYR
jgi:hypothetical protein